MNRADQKHNITVIIQYNMSMNRADQKHNITVQKLTLFNWYLGFKFWHISTYGFHCLPCCNSGFPTLATQISMDLQTNISLNRVFQNCVRQSAVALLLKAALIQVSDYRLLGASCFLVQI
jgi:hypothetical protein